MNESVNEQLKDVTKAIEDSYNELYLVIKQISQLNDVLNAIKSSSDTIRQEYSEILDNTKLKETEAEYQKTVDKIDKSLKKLQDGIINIQTIRRIADENMNIVIDKMKRFESLIDKFNDRSSKLDKKLSKSLETLKLNQTNVETNAKKALKMIELNYQADKYDEILNLQKENNELLKSLKSKQERKPRRNYSSQVKTTGSER